jgi:hypothetical protein
VRIAHWLFVLCVAGSWLTHQAGVQWFGWHRRFGYATLVLVSFRILWGFAGTRHARFANFLRGPRAVVEYLRRGGAGEPVGHNPLGALNVVALLALMLVQAITGLFANDEITNTGPFYGWVRLKPVIASGTAMVRRLAAGADRVAWLPWVGTPWRAGRATAARDGDRRKDAERVPEEGISCPGGLAV